MIKLTEDTNSHQNKWPQKLITASLAVSKQILHSKLAFAFGCSLFDAPEAEDGSFVEGISPPEVAILFSLAMLILAIRHGELGTRTTFYDSEQEKD